jgi:PleD family two-component response regulator
MIFVLEPDTLLLDSLVSHLRRHADIMPFRTSTQLLKALNTDIPDCIVMELALPEHNGFELLYELMSFSDTRGIRVIVYTSLHQSALKWGVVSPGDLQISQVFYKSETNIDELIREALGFA